MIKVFVTKYEIYFRKDNNIFQFSYYELEKEIENILEKLEMEENNKICLILDFEADELEYYTTIFEYHNIKVKKAINFIDVLKNTKREIIEIGNEQSIIINKEKIEIINITKSDEYDYGNMEVIKINEESMEYIFELCDKYGNNNLLYKTNYIYIFIIILLINLSSHIFSYFYYNTNLLEKEIIKNKNYKIEIEHKRDKFISNIKNIEIEIKKYEIDNILKKLSKKEYYKLIEFIIKLVNAGFQFTNIEYINKKLILEGQIDEIEKLNIHLKEFNIEYLINIEDKIAFKVIGVFEIDK